MNRLIVFLLVLGVVAAGLTLVSLSGQPPEAGQAPRPVAYVALGDSLATGTGAERGYPARFADALETETGRDVRGTNLARDGATSDDLLAALRDDEELRTAVAAADVVTFDIGGNDLLGVVAGRLPPADAVATFRGNWEAILDELEAVAPPDAVLATADLYNPFVAQLEALGVRAVLEPHLAEVNDHITSTAGSRGIAVAPVHEAFNGPAGDDDPVAAGLISDDGLHPSDDGHERIAHLLVAVTAEQLYEGR